MGGDVECTLEEHRTLSALQYRDSLTRLVQAVSQLWMSGKTLDNFDQ